MSTAGDEPPRPPDPRPHPVPVPDTPASGTGPGTGPEDATPPTADPQAAEPAAAAESGPTDGVHDVERSRAPEVSPDGLPPGRAPGGGDEPAPRPPDGAAAAAGGGTPDEHFPERLCLPFVATASVVALCHDALDQAAAARTGVVLVAPKGAGKSRALRHVIGRFALADRLRAGRDPAYRRRRVVAVSTLRASTYRDALLDLLYAVAGASHRDRVRGRVKTLDELRIELAEMLLDLGVVVVVVDDAETLSDHALTALRDVMVETATRDPAGAPGADGAQAPAGVGMLLAGTGDLTPRLLRSDEAGQRYARLVSAGLVPAAHVAGVYRLWLPGFEAHVAAIGEAAWAGYVRTLVTRGKPVALRRLEAHVREYARRLARRDPRRVTAREAVYFAAEPFELTWGESGWADGTAGGT